MSSINNRYHKHDRSEVSIVIPETYSKILEIGCGEGEFRSTITKANEYWGIEPDKGVAQQAVKNLDKVLVGYFDDCKNKLTEGYFDLIVCNDVIEHMDDYIGFLNEIKKYLSPNGYLVASIPNVRYLNNLFHLLFEKDWRYREAGILDRTHLRFFTKKSIKRALVTTGWEITQIKGINRYGSNRIGHKLLLSYIGQVIFGRDSAYLQFAICAKVKST